MVPGKRGFFRAATLPFDNGVGSLSRGLLLFVAAAGAEVVMGGALRRPPTVRGSSRNRVAVGATYAVVVALLSVDTPGGVLFKSGAEGVTGVSGDNAFGVCVLDETPGEAVCLEGFESGRERDLSTCG